MVKDHAKILGLLKDTMSYIGGDTGSLLKSFHIFEWNLEKHFFVEERAIFTSYNPKQVFEGYNMFIKLTKEHTLILDTLKSIKKHLLQDKPVSLSEVRELLIQHKTFEEQSIYPPLDKELDEAEKAFIIERISEIV
jgi:hypothetical protein